MRHSPNTLFKYEPFTLQAVQNLKRQSIFFGSPSSFNDPFDCAIAPILIEPSTIEANAIAARLMSDHETPPHVRQLFVSIPQHQLISALMMSASSIISEQRNDFNTVKGITCFSECNDNLLMWSHYGGQHRGFCLEFDVSLEPLIKRRPVLYSKTIPQLPIAEFMLTNDYECILDLFCTKSEDWAYEREWRVIHGKAGTVFTYAPQALKAIYFGARMTDQDIDMLCLILSGQNPNVALYRGQRSESEFKIAFAPFTYTTLANTPGASKA